MSLTLYDTNDDMISPTTAITTFPHNISAKSGISGDVITLTNSSGNLTISFANANTDAESHNDTFAFAYVNQTGSTITTDLTLTFQSSPNATLPDRLDAITSFGGSALIIGFNADGSLLFGSIQLPYSSGTFTTVTLPTAANNLENDGYVIYRILYTDVPANPSAKDGGGAPGWSSFVYTELSCFLESCRIMLADGTSKQIKDIRKGDILMGLFSKGPVTIKNIGYCVAHLEMTDKENLPYTIPSDFISKGVPDRDTELSGLHSIYVADDSGELKMVKVNELGVDVSRTEGDVRYYHIELEDNNEGLYVNNMPTESLRDCDWETSDFIDL
jgi:hypothetical protein